MQQIFLDLYGTQKSHKGDNLHKLDLTTNLGAAVSTAERTKAIFVPTMAPCSCQPPVLDIK
jgi:hypothetical protein